MAVGRLLPTGTRGPSLRGSLVVYPWRGRLIARAWPKKRGRKLHPKVREQVEWFKEAVQLAKYADPESQRRAIEWSKGTGLYPRDLIVHAMAGNLLEFADEDGNVYKKLKFATETAVFQGARVVRTTTITIPANVTFVINWELPIIQTVSIWSPANPDRLTVPEGVSIISIEAGVQSHVTKGGLWVLNIKDKVGTVYSGNGAEFNGFRNIFASTGPIPVSPGDFFIVDTFSVGTRQLTAGPGVFFSMTLLEVE